MFTLDYVLADLSKGGEVQGHPVNIALHARLGQIDHLASCLQVPNPTEHC